MERMEESQQSGVSSSIRKMESSFMLWLLCIPIFLLLCVAKSDQKQFRAGKHLIQLPGHSLSVKDSSRNFVVNLTKQRFLPDSRSVSCLASFLITVGHLPSDGTAHSGPGGP